MTEEWDVEDGIVSEPTVAPAHRPDRAPVHPSPAKGRSGVSSEVSRVRADGAAPNDERVSDPAKWEQGVAQAERPIDIETATHAAAIDEGPRTG